MLPFQYFTLALFLLISCSAFGVKKDNKLPLHVAFQVDYGTYDMKDLRDINTDVIKNLPFKARVVSDIPGYINFKGMVLLEQGGFLIGPTIAFQSTGSRVSSVDYSGEYNFDLKVSSTNIGFLGSYSILSKEKYSLGIYSDVGIILSKLEVEENVTAYDHLVLDEDQNLSSRNFFYEPGIVYHFLRNKILSCRISMGYQLQFGDKNFRLDKQETTISPQWEGLRLGVSLFF